MVLIRAVTPLHAGAGRAGEFVDLPIQRDEFGYPCIYSSSLKGALKTALLNAFTKRQGDYNKAKEAVKTLLGPEPEEGETFESSIAVLDAYLLSMPVRSLKGLYAYITSPHLLAIFAERLGLLRAFGSPASIALEELDKLNLEEDEALCINNCDTIKIKELENKALLAEETILTLKENTDPKNLKESLKNLATALQLEKPLLITNNETALRLIDKSILRIARIALMREKKKVRAGPWTEEYLPRGATLHTLLLYKNPHPNPPTSKEKTNYTEILEELGLVSKNTTKIFNEAKNPTEKQAIITENISHTLKEICTTDLHNHLVLGGHETIGKGIVKLIFL